MRLRTLGVNAARLVKAEPLVFNDKPLLDAYARSSLDLPSTEPDDLVAIITKVLVEFMDNK